jgi:hypothetical protein
LLSAVYPQQEWIPYRFDARLPPKFWEDINNQIKFVDWVAKQLNVKEYSDWYKFQLEVQKLVAVCIRFQELCKLGGSSILKYHKSLYSLLCATKVQYKWLPWKFVKVPVHFFEDMRHRREFMDWAGEELGIKNFSDWYQVQHHVGCVL